MIFLFFFKLTKVVKMAFTPMRAKISKTQKFLAHGNQFLFLFSTLEIFTAVIFIFFYHLPTVGLYQNNQHFHTYFQLSFWTLSFSVTPLAMAGLGLYKLAVSVFMKVTKTKAARCYFPEYFKQIIVSPRCHILLYAVCLSFSFLVQIWSSFSALELRKQVTTERAPVRWMQEVRAGICPQVIVFIYFRTWLCMARTPG